MSELEASARELVAWFKSGNDLPVDLLQQVKRNKDRIMADVDRLDKALDRSKNSH